MTLISEQERLRRQRAVNQVLASSATDGHQPEQAYLMLLNRYISGELSIDQVSAETNKQFGTLTLRTTKNK